jgi:hypothetical protein
MFTHYVLWGLMRGRGGIAPTVVDVSVDGGGLWLSFPIWCW